MRTDRRGQALYEFAIGVFLFTLVFTALVEFAPVFLKNFELQSTARADAGIAALHADEGNAAAGGNAAAITTRAHPSVEWSGGRDPWEYPIENLPAESRFADWRGNALQSIRLIDGSAKKDYTFTLRLGGEALIDHEQGELSEEVHMPALGGVRTPGVNP